MRSTDTVALPMRSVHDEFMPRPYKYLAGLVLAVGAAIAAMILVTGLSHPVARGLYTDRDAEKVLGFHVRRPSYLPRPLDTATPKPVLVLPEGRSSAISYDVLNTRSDNNSPQAPSTSLSVEQGPTGTLKDEQGTERVRRASVHGRAATFGSVGFIRVLYWQDGRLDYLLSASNLPDGDILRVAGSLR